MASYARGEAARRIWRERLERYERSGLSAREFCAQEGVSYPSLYQWKKRLAASNSSTSPTSGSRLQPVQVVGESGVTVEFPDVASLRIPASQVDLVRAIVAELAAATRGHESC